MMDRTSPLPTTADPDPESARVERLLWEADCLVRAERAFVDDADLVIGTEGAREPRVSLGLPPEVGPVTVRIPLAEDSRDRDQPDPRSLLEALGASVRDGLRGSVTIEQGDRDIALFWTPPASLVPAEALAVARALGAELAEAIADGAAAEARRTTIAARLERRLALLDLAFPERSARRDPGAGRLLDLASPGAGSGVWVVQRRIDLVSPEAGSGLWLGIHIAAESHAGQRALVDALVPQLWHRFGLALELSDDPSLLPTSARRAGAIALAPAGRCELDFADLVAALRDVARFVRSLDVARAEGIDLYDVFEVERPADDGGDDFVAEEVAEEPEPEPVPLPEPSRANAVLAFIGPEHSGPTKAMPEWPPKNLAPIGQAGPSPAAPPPAPGPPALDRMSAREVVKRLQAAEATSDVDVFMTHPGYNVEKTVKIMSIVLSLSRDEALSRCENVPALLASQVTRAKAAQLKTVLEGTGARIRVVLPSEDDAPA